MSEQIDYQILLQEVVKTAVEAARRAKHKGDQGVLYAYYDIIDVVKTQAEVMDVPLSEVGLDGVDVDTFLP
ncbi:hypothetical protein [Methylomicrobium agile]|uniref:hypothetical protein n=1 Tax=Methylomicrobium agile TaxID=39774 RepID=UPI0004DED061|nr:hypothetical protein [Methylomicrobium agile]